MQNILKKGSLSLASGNRSSAVLLTFTLSYFPCSYKQYCPLEIIFPPEYYSPEQNKSNQNGAFTDNDCEQTILETENILSIWVAFLFGSFLVSFSTTMLYTAEVARHRLLLFFWKDIKGLRSVKRLYSTSL